MAMLDAFGHEVLDSTPKSVTVPFRRPEPLHLRIRRMILETARQEHEGFESFEDADDFEVGDPADYEDQTTPYEEHFDPITGGRKFSWTKPIESPAESAPPEPDAPAPESKSEEKTDS